MKIEIWSDVVCPFCFIGKRKLEEALKSFDNVIDIQIDWKSYLLNPNLKVLPNETFYQNFIRGKGIPMDRALEMTYHVSEMGKEVDINFNFEKVIPSSSILAHQFLHLAKEFSKQNEAKELLFRAYFLEGKDIGKMETIIAISQELQIPIESSHIRSKVLEFNDEVDFDLQEAINFQIQGVPFFVFDRKYAISGAQPVNVFIETIRQTLTSVPQK